MTTTISRRLRTRQWRCQALSIYSRRKSWRTPAAWLPLPDISRRGLIAGRRRSAFTNLMSRFCHTLLSNTSTIRLNSHCQPARARGFTDANRLQQFAQQNLAELFHYLIDATPAEPIYHPWLRRLSFHHDELLRAHAINASLLPRAGTRLADSTGRRAPAAHPLRAQRRRQPVQDRRGARARHGDTRPDGEQLGLYPRRRRGGEAQPERHRRERHARRLQPDYGPLHPDDGHQGAPGPADVPHPLLHRPPRFDGLHGCIAHCVAAPTRRRP